MHRRKTILKQIKAVIPETGEWDRLGMAAQGGNVSRPQRISEDRDGEEERADANGLKIKFAYVSDLAICAL